ncbi:MAG: molecular chaperone HtpG [Anaerolineaceae bacterium]|nr:molecular chaperone HtpG [Anaerolineaceae bacterium]
MTDIQESAQTFQFQTETKQLLKILIHSIYTDQDVFLRELISNASDALTRLKFVMLTEKEGVDTDADPGIWITIDKENKTITIRDNGIGMTRDEIVENLGTIAHSGVKQFMDAVTESNANLTDIIGQFGVGFYSAFMVAEEIEVHTRAYKKDEEAVLWRSNGEEQYTLETSDKIDRGTEIILHLNEKAEEFLEEYRVQTTIKKYSDFIPYPIFVGENEEPVNRQTALWRQTPMSIEEEEYKNFYQQYTMDFEEPLTKLHLTIDAPVQMYSLLYIPSNPERTMFSPRQQGGLELYARKVLIQEYTLDLLPHSFRFIQGVIDSEDIPLNVSRETIQSTRVMRQIKKVITSRMINHLKEMRRKEPSDYANFWEAYHQFIKEGVATDDEYFEKMSDLLVFHTNKHPDEWISLDQYIDAMPEGQEKIYYLLAADYSSATMSPHLELMEEKDYEVLFLAEDVDPFMMLRLQNYKEKSFANIAAEEVNSDEKTDDSKKDDEKEDQEHEGLISHFKSTLSERVSDVRLTNRLARSPARLVDAGGEMTQEMQRVYEMLNRDFEKPNKVLEVNTSHPLIQKLEQLPEDDPRSSLIIEQIFEDTLLLEGIHPNPASMIERIQKIMEASLE